LPSFGSLTCSVDAGLPLDMGFGSLRNCVIGLLSFLQLALELWAGFWGLFTVELAGCSPVLFSFQFRESIVLLIHRCLHFSSIEQFY